LYPLLSYQKVSDRSLEFEISDLDAEAQVYQSMKAGKYSLKGIRDYDAFPIELQGIMSLIWKMKLAFQLKLVSIGPDREQQYEIKNKAFNTMKAFCVLRFPIIFLIFTQSKKN